MKIVPIPLLTFFSISIASINAMEKPLQPYDRSYIGWKMFSDVCLENPSNAFGANSPLTATELLNEIESFCQAQKKGILSKPETWVETDEQTPAMPEPEFFNGTSFVPYIQKIRVTGDKILIQGDLHGDLESANNLLDFLAQKGFTNPKNPFQITDPKFKILFLGDYTDRGKFGAEVLYIVSRLKRTNPNCFFATRGNHEDIRLNKKHGLAAELQSKFGINDSELILAKLKRIYNYLPVAILLQSDNDAFIGMHGGPELGSLNISKLLDAPGQNRCMLLNTLMRETVVKQTPSNYQCCYDNIRQRFPEELQNLNPSAQEHPEIHVGFLWNEFKFTTNNDPEESLEFDENRGFRFPKGLTQYLFYKDSTPTCKIRGALVAHQHSPETLKRIFNLDGQSESEDTGVAKLWLPEGTKQPAGTLWDGIVCNFGVAPNVGYGVEGQSYNAVGLLTITPNFEDWRLEMHRIESRRPLFK